MTKQDLSRIDFSKCKLPEWIGRAIQADFDVGRVGLFRGGKRVAFKGDAGWVLTRARGYTLSHVEELHPICDLVDEFIANELARFAIEDAEKQGALGHCASVVGLGVRVRPGVHVEDGTPVSIVKGLIVSQSGAVGDLVVKI